MSRDQDDYLPLLTPGSQLDLGKGDPVDRSRLSLTKPDPTLFCHLVLHNRYIPGWVGLGIQHL